MWRLAHLRRVRLALHFGRVATPEGLPRQRLLCTRAGKQRCNHSRCCIPLCGCTSSERNASTRPTRS